MAKSTKVKPGLELTDEKAPSNGPVECLGRTFENDDARRVFFAEALREKLKDPAFRQQDRFPQGTDEDILRVSDPPFYTACPNPFLDDFVRCYGRPYDPSEPYQREPFAVDTSVGKTDALYKAHGYHTKVPHLAIVPSILHYTKPGDIVIDGFAGSGMTGVAAQWCGAAPAEYRKQLELEWKRDGRPKPEWGARRAILNDLGPAATFISAGYNLPFDLKAFTKAAEQILDDVERELGWMIEHDFDVHLTSDHGNIESRGVGKPDAGDVPEISASRVFVFPDPHTRRVYAERFPGTVEWAGVGLPPGNFALMAPSRGSFLDMGSRALSHGGMSLEEVIVPFVSIARRRP